MEDTSQPAMRDRFIAEFGEGAGTAAEESRAGDSELLDALDEWDLDRNEWWISAPACHPLGLEGRGFPR